MVGMWAGYIWGDNVSWTLKFDSPRFTFADASLQDIRVYEGGPIVATAWVRSVTVQDPSTGQITELPSDHTAAVRIEDNAIAVTYGLNGSFNMEATALIHAFWW